MNEKISQHSTSEKAPKSEPDNNLNNFVQQRSMMICYGSQRTRSNMAVSKRFPENKMAMFEIRPLTVFRTGRV
jgi:hypothetical protein